MPQKAKAKAKTADEIIAEAKAAYKAAGGGQVHEYSNAPYKMAAPKKETPVAKPAAETGIKQEAKDAGAAIAYRLKQQKALTGQ